MLKNHDFSRFRVTQKSHYGLEHPLIESFGKQLSKYVKVTEQEVIKRSIVELASIKKNPHVNDRILILPMNEKNEKYICLST